MQLIVITLALIAIISSVITAKGYCNNLEAGLPFIQSFTPEQYGSLGQNTDIVQDEDGIIYIANCENLDYG